MRLMRTAIVLKIKTGVGAAILCLYALLLALSLSAFGCGRARANKPPNTPPSPDSVTREEPGGDSSEPQRAALLRLNGEPWGWRNDKQDIFHFPLSDWPNWRRVRYWGIPAFVGFRYGDSHRAVAALWLRRLRPNDPEDESVCLERMQIWTKPIVEVYQTTLAMGKSSRASWKAKDDVIVQSVDAQVSSVFSHRTYRAVVAATFAWPRICLLYGYAFRDDSVDGSDDTAARVRDRYATEAFSKMTVLDPLVPPEGITELP